MIRTNALFELEKYFTEVLLLIWFLKGRIQGSRNIYWIMYDLRQLGVKLYGQVIIDGNGLTGKDVLIKLIDSLLSKDFCCTPWLVKGQRNIFKLLSHFLLRESTEL